MAFHQLKLYVPGAPEPPIPARAIAVTASLTNLYYPNVRDELEVGKTVAEWEATPFNTAMSPVYDVLHVFTEAVSTYEATTGDGMVELRMHTMGPLAGIVYGYFDGNGIGDYQSVMEWGDIFMLTKQTDPDMNGMYMALPSEMYLGSRVVRTFRRLGDNLTDQYTSRHYKPTSSVGNVEITMDAARTGMRVYGLASDAENLPAWGAGMPLEATYAAWGDAVGDHVATSETLFGWIPGGAMVHGRGSLSMMPDSGLLTTPFVFLDLAHQTDPEENGVWRYDFVSGNFDSGGVRYRQFERVPIMQGNLHLFEPVSRYFSFNVKITHGGALHYGQQAGPRAPLQFGTGSLALLLAPPGDGLYNVPVQTLLPQTRSADIYAVPGVSGHELPDGSWLLASGIGHDAVFIVRVTVEDGSLVFGDTESYRTAAAGTLASSLTAEGFEMLPLAEIYGERGVQGVLVKPPVNTFMFLSDVVVTERPGSLPASFKNSGTLRCGREFEADSMAFTHTLLQQRFGSSDTALDELRLRGLSVELPGIFASHSISHSSSGVGGEHGRAPHVNIHIEDGQKTTSVERHNIHYRALRIPHEIDYKFVYTDTGEALAAEHGDVVGKCTLTAQFTGFVV
jgi:hypothetical protein